MDEAIMWLLAADPEIALVLALMLGLAIVVAAVAAFRWIKRWLGIDNDDDGFFIGIGF